MEATGEGSPKKPGRVRHGVDVVLDFIAGCVSPVIPVLLASGLIAAVLSVCVNFFGMDTGSGTAASTVSSGNKNGLTVPGSTLSSSLYTAASNSTPKITGITVEL